MALQPNDSIGPYVLLRPLGRGAFGEVWLARHHHLDEERALKVPKDPAYVRQLRTEGTIQFQLNHPNIVHTLDLVPDHDPPYCVMEFVAGVNLRQKLRAAGKLSLVEVLAILNQILLALQHAHAAGICHRDLKPENILCRADGVVKVTDFGFGSVKAVLAQSMIFSGSLADAGAGGITGTVQYMSPQQQAGEAADPRDDLYAVGVIACELLTGSRPQPMGVMKMLDRAGADVAFATVLEKAMEQERKDRYASAAEMRDALAAFSARASPPAVITRPMQLPSGPRPGEWTPVARCRTIGDWHATKHALATANIVGRMGESMPARPVEEVSGDCTDLLVQTEDLPRAQAIVEAHRAGKIWCPRCGSTQVQETPPVRHWYTLPMHVLGLGAFLTAAKRCEKCGHKWG